jgi:RNA polymerase sigma-70 factor (ECF subfamily)
MRALRATDTMTDAATLAAGCMLALPPTPAVGAGAGHAVHPPRQRPVAPPVIASIGRRRAMMASTLGSQTMEDRSGFVRWPLSVTIAPLPHPLRGNPMGAAPAEDEDDPLQHLWLKAQRGDEIAYRAALGGISARVRAFLRRRMGGTPDDVEDLVQETLVALHLKRSSYDPAFPLMSWVLAIARHKLADHWRRRGRRDALHDPLDEVPEEALSAKPSPPETSHDLERLLQTLPELQRTAIVLTKLEGLSVAEAALRSRASESAIKVRVHRGLAALAALLRK